MNASTRNTGNTGGERIVVSLQRVGVWPFLARCVGCLMPQGSRPSPESHLRFSLANSSHESQPIDYLAGRYT